jgi:acetyl esterase/lipase
MKFAWTILPLIGAMTLSRLHLLAAAEPELKPETHTFKRVGDLAIKADVYKPVQAGRRPVVVWIHGGGLIMGGRAGIDRRIFRKLIDAGYAVISIDYRLAPQTKLPDIIADVEDAFAWIHGEGGRTLNLDTNRIAVMGGSAGGYLTLVSGHRVKPRPKVLVSFWGYGEIIGPWYSEPSPHPRHQTVKITDEEAQGFIAGPPVANDGERKPGGGSSGFYQYCRQRGLWPKHVTGWDPRAEAARFVPYMPLRNVSSDYPPTLLIHGKADTDVPYEQSEMMAQELSKHHVPHKLIGLDNAEHGLGGGDRAAIDQAYETALSFVKKYLGE